MHTFEELVAVVETLRSENGCPWDRKQTLESLKLDCQHFFRQLF